MKDILISGVKTAGKFLKEDFYKSKTVTNKGVADLVTETDLKIEEFLKDYFYRHLSDYRFVGEETNQNLNFKDKCLIVDPIDGTTNFVHRFPFVGISVGVYENLNPVAATVYNPILDELYYAERGKGAFLNGNRIFVSAQSKIENSLLATGFPYGFVEKNKKDILTKLDRILSSSRGIRRAGAASLDLCYVAQGVFDGYYEGGLKPWDVAAGVLIVNEAGGKISNIKGDNFSFEDEYIVASNKTIHNELIEVLCGI
ncbi:inositol monophosphatase [Deferribacteraceae bacterium V6Fe1]|nr:inositol monophosphatase [Deferribacteraceae bacterium V6Fe1]